MEEAFHDTKMLDRTFKNIIEINPYTQISNIYIYSQSNTFSENINVKNFKESRNKTALQNIIIYENNLAISLNQQL